MLAGRTEKRDVPHAEGQWVEFRTLSGRELDEAEDAQTRRGMEMVKGFDLSAIRGAAASVERAPIDAYDKDTLIKYGVAAWSLDVPCDAANKGKLDAETRSWAVSVIVEMNVRTSGESNGSGGISLVSTSHQNSSEPIESSPVE